MTVGAEPKKVAVLAGLIVAALVALYMNSSSDSSPAPAPRIVSNAPANAGLSAAKTTNPPRTKGRVATPEFRARVLGTRPDDAKIDPRSIDPDLNLGLLAKVQAIEPIDAGRNLFQFGSAPAPPKPIAAVPTNVPPIPIAHPTPPPPPVVASGPPPPPPPPPITWKYYGYAVRKGDGRKVALLQDGDDILTLTENQTIKHYRVARITLTSIDVEDTDVKSTQTLKIQDSPT